MHARRPRLPFGWGRRASLRALGGRALLGGLAALTLATAGCDDPEALPYGITSLAVLPVDVAPFHPFTGRAAGEMLTQELARKTSFRIVGVDSSQRLLAGPQGDELYGRFRDQAKTSGFASFQLSKALGDRLNAQGLVLGLLQISFRGAVDGRVALTVGIFERGSGRRVWTHRAEREFRGVQGDPSFLRVVNGLVSAIVGEMPHPAGED